MAFCTSGGVLCGATAALALASETQVLLPFVQRPDVSRCEMLASSRRPQALRLL